MDKEVLYENFKKHIEQWQQFLEMSVDSLKKEDGQFVKNPDKNINLDIDGELIKKDRQLKILTNVLNGAVCNPKLLIDFICPEYCEEIKIEKIPDNLWIQKNLDSAQKEAVARAIQTDSLAFIQGPPGTGKTTVITEICLQLLRINPMIRILVCSETHVAVDNLIEKFLKLEEVGRVSHLNCVRAFAKNKDGKDNSTEDVSVNSRIDEYVNILHKACVNENIIGELMELFNKNTKAISKEFMLNADIVGVTCNSLARINFNVNETFDYVIFDEVCKATFPEILIPLSISKRAILVGDPNQLPPVFLQEEQEIMDRIDECKLTEYMYIDTLFDRLKDDKKKFLENQYRMTNEIGNIISKHFYNAKLKNGRNVSIKDSILWYDYDPSGEWGKGSGSPYNLDEVDIVKKILAEQNRKGEKIQVAVITSYKGQKGELIKAINKKEYPNLNIDIDTIDSFQGKDADVVIFCITRTTGSLMFFSNPRRLNVALSRAKNLCCIIGYSKFATNNKTLRNIYNSIKHIKIEGE